MKALLCLLLVITSAIEGYSHPLINVNENNLNINDLLGLEANNSELERLVEQTKANDGFLPYSVLQGRKVYLSQLPSKDDFLTLKIWGKWISTNQEDSLDSFSSMRLWKNPNLLIAPKLYHHHKPTTDSQSGLSVWKIPLGKCDFILGQNFHFSLPDWNLAQLFEINRIEVTSGQLMGTNISIDQIFNETNIDKLFSQDQWTHSFQLLDRWFVLIITIQIILAFCMLRYFMLAQAYLCLMFFCLLASYWYQWPFRYDTEKATLVETNSKLRRVVQRGVDIPRMVEFEFNTKLQSLMKELRVLSLKKNGLDKSFNEFSSKARKLGVEIILESETYRRTINVSTKKIKSLDDPNINNFIEVLHELVKESLTIQQFKELDIERNDQFNKKLKTFEELFGGLFGKNQSLTKLINDSDRLISWQTNQLVQAQYIYWSYFWDNNKNLVIAVFRLKPETYANYIERYVDNFYSKELKLENWTNGVIYFRNKYGSFNSSQQNASEKFIDLHEHFIESTEFLHYDYHNNNHELYFGSKFEAIPNQRIILKVTANNLASKIMEDKRELSLQKLSMIVLIPLLGLSISALVSWRLRSLRRSLESMRMSGDLEKLEIEGRDQISDLSIQVNRLLIEPIKRQKFIRLKTDCYERDSKILSLFDDQENGEQEHQLVYVVLDSQSNRVPELLSKSVNWICKDYRNRLTGWCQIDELMKVFTSNDGCSNFNTNDFRNCRIDLLKMDYKVTRYEYQALNEIPSVIPILPDSYNPVLHEPVHKQQTDLQVFTTLEEKYRKIILSSVEGYRKWNKIVSEGLDGYHLH